MVNNRFLAISTIVISLIVVVLFETLINTQSSVVFAQSGVDNNSSAENASFNVAVRPTATPTKKPTVTRTKVRSKTPTPTRTKTRTPTRIKTLTATRTRTRTPTRTKTQTPTQTRSKTPTPTLTATIAETATPTQTRSKTPTPTLTGTLTATITETATPTQTTISQTPQAYLEYQIYGGTVITDSTMPPVLPGGQADYSEIFAEHNLCALIASGQVDEVWIWAGNGDGITKGNMYEWTTSGGSWSGATPDCGKMATTLTFNYLREVDVALESYTHRLEGVFGRYFMCDFSTATWPWAGSTTWPYSQCGNLLSNRYGFVARPSVDNDQIAGCGDAHHPPNILNNQEYDYSNITTVQTICPSWSEDGSAVPTSVNCNDWGCTHWNFFIWWMQNVPGVNNINKDRNGNPQPNWWSYLFGVPSSPTNNPITRKVYVIYYPGYGGTPRADVNTLTTELIGLLKEGTIYHGYEYSALHANFLGQDGESYAGTGCNAGTAADNIHIHVNGLRTDVSVTGYSVQDAGGYWSVPCNPASNWLVHAISDSPAPGQADLYFKPYRIAPAGTAYIVTIKYSDGTNRSVAVIAGTQVQP